MNILLIQLDFPKWNQAKAWSYAAQFSFEEGFNKIKGFFQHINTHLENKKNQCC